MRVVDWNSLSRDERHEVLSRPAVQARPDITAVAQQVIAAVRSEGDAAVRSYTERFDGVRLEVMAVSRDEFAAAAHSLSVAQRTAIERAIENVHRFHSAQLPQPYSLQTMPGVRCERIIRPIGAVGLYVPAGSAPLPSTAIMLGVPARIAGCPQRILCTPPDRAGRAHPAILMAAKLCGIDTIFKVGGAQAIAALAYGTESIPKADKIFGPGNAWVTAAKQLVAQDPAAAACDLPAGPSEVMIVADESARADFVAADLLAQAEHDAHSQAILVTCVRSLANAVSAALETQSQSLSRRTVLAQSLTQCRCIVVPDLHTAMDVANDYAPEHLLLEVRESRRWLAQIRNAGAIFLGEWSAEAMGDYCSGTNHVLPTYGCARAYSGLSVGDFVKSVAVQELTAAGLLALGPVAVELALLEGLDGHASSVRRRLAVLSSPCLSARAALDGAS